MNDIEKAIKLCKAEIKFYKNELEQPHMKEHKSTYDAYISGHNEAYANCVNSIESFEFIISVLKEKQQREWIPVSERLPENYQRLIVCTKDGYLYLSRFTPNRFIDIEYNPFKPKQEQTIDDVFAWMPLPEPYKEASHEPIF